MLTNMEKPLNLLELEPASQKLIQNFSKWVIESNKLCDEIEDETNKTIIDTDKIDELLKRLTRAEEESEKCLKEIEEFKKSVDYYS